MTSVDAKEAVDIARYLGSEFFKIVIAGPPENRDEINEGFPTSDTDSTAEENTTIQSPNNANDSKPDPQKPENLSRMTEESALFVHKALLASLSPELEKHTNNDMKEGIEGVMTLHEVDCPTLRRFLEWAYTQDYSVPKLQNGKGLFVHIKLFILADRFNVKKLMHLSFARFTAELSAFNKPTIKFKAMEIIMGACIFTYAKLPTRHPNQMSLIDVTYSSTDSTAPGAYLMHFIAWQIKAFRQSPKFDMFLEQNGDFAKSFLYMCLGADCPPWEPKTVIASPNIAPAYPKRTGLFGTPYN
ncbi:hypothetical protein DFH27DRAFT_597480 [Peziza echinospora]|nr:hypothetical protein DFH27DRAFT_597480 [Peziza echinospora]